MHTDQFNHAPAELLLFTGHPRQGRPSMGSWVTYGLGSENQNLPGFVVAHLQRRATERRPRLLGKRLPSIGLSRRAVPLDKGIRSSLRPIRPGMTRDMRRTDARRLARPQRSDRHANSAIRKPPPGLRNTNSPIRMQTSVPEVMDIARESKATHRGVRRAARRIEFRKQLSARAAARRAGCALRASFRLGLGFPRHESGRGHPRRPHAKNGARRTSPLPHCSVI